MLTGPSVHLTSQLDQTQFDQLVKLIFTVGQEGSGSTPETISTDMETASKSEVDLIAEDTSLAEYFRHTQAIRVPDKIVAYAAYLRQEKRIEAFTRQELVRAFEQAQEVVPKNLSRDLSWAVKIGWIAPSSHRPGSFYLTQAGEAAVGAKFPIDLRKKTSIHKLKKS